MSCLVISCLSLSRRVLSCLVLSGVVLTCLSFVLPSSCLVIVLPFLVLSRRWEHEGNDWQRRDNKTSGNFRCRCRWRFRVRFRVRVRSSLSANAEILLKCTCLTSVRAQRQRKTRVHSIQKKYRYPFNSKDHGEHYYGSSRVKTRQTTRDKTRGGKARQKIPVNCR